MRYLDVTVIFTPSHAAPRKVEYMVILFDHEQKNAKLSLRQTEFLAKLDEVVRTLSDGASET